MGKYSSSSAQSKPLLFLSLAASLVLHAGGLYFLLRHPPSFLTAREIPTVEHFYDGEELDTAVSEAFQNLIIHDHESSPPYNNNPRMESGKIPLIVTDRDCSISPGVIEKTSSLLEIAPYSPSIILEDSWITSKSSPFHDKKTINFNRKIAKESTEEFLSSPFIIATQKEDAIVSNPYVEEKEDKVDFLSALFSKDGDIRSHSLQTPLGRTPEFKHPSDTSELIDHNILPQKKSLSSFHPLKHPRVAVKPSKREGRKEDAIASIVPKTEGLKKLSFDPDIHQYYCDYTSETLPRPFSLTLPMKDELLTSPYFSEKKSCPTNPHFASGYFKNLKKTDVSQLIEAQSEAPLVPSQEKLEGFWVSEKISFQFELDFDREPPLFSQVEPTATSLSRTPFCAKKTSLAKKPLAMKEFEHIPYLDPWEEVEIVSHETYIPGKEERGAEPRKFSLPSGPSIAVGMGSSVFSFTLAPPFDLFSSEDGIAPPKKMQKFAASNLDVSPYYFSTESLEDLAMSPTSPQLEGSVPPALADESFMSQPSIEVPPSSFGFPKGEVGDSLPMIAREMTFPQGQTIPSKLQLKAQSQTYLSTLQDESKIQHAQKPTLHKKKLSIEGKIPEITLPHFISSAPHFDIEKAFTLNLNEGKLHYEKHPDRKQKCIDLQVLPLPQQVKKGMTPKKIVGGLTTPKMWAHLASRPPLFPNTREVLATQPMPIEEDQGALPLKTTAYGPLHPIFDSSEVPHLALEGTSPFMLKEGFDYMKKTESPPPLDGPNLSLPYLREKRVNPNKAPATSKKALEALPDCGVLATLTKRPTAFPNAREVLESSPLPTKEVPPLSEGIYQPLRPAFYPPELPHLALEAAAPSMMEENLEYMKKKILPDALAAEDFPLPYLRGKSVNPSKTPMTPRQTLEALPAPDVLADLASRSSPFPNTQKLLGQSPAPSLVSSEVSIEVALEEPDTEMIRSQAKELLEDYNQENSASSAFLTLVDREENPSPNLEEAHTLNQSSRFTNAFLTEIPPPSYLETTTYANEFDTEVHYSKREDGKGYLFALKVKPRKDLNFASPHQNILFVIDGSSSIKKHRFGVFKNGVSRSLSYLKEGDSFNIIVADAEMAPFSKTPVSWNKKTAAQAKHFLNERDYRGFFINYDAFDLLASVTKYFDPEKENIIVLITDGHSFQTFKQHKEDFQELAEASQGRFSIFTATASQDNNLTMLDLLSTFNNGELMYSKTHAAFSRQLAVMVKHIEHLVAKDVHIHVTGHKQETGIEFYPNQGALPSFYSDRPYTIYGTIDELKDFDLILQGRAGDQWVNIKQHISFKHAEKATHSIKRGFALQKAYVCYDYYLQKDDPFFLNEAEKILNPHFIPSANR